MGDHRIRSGRTKVLDLHCPTSSADGKLALALPLKGNLRPMLWPQPSQWTKLKDRKIDIVFHAWYGLGKAKAIPAVDQHRVLGAESVERLGASPSL